MFDDNEYFPHVIMPDIYRFIFAPLKNDQLHRGQFREELFKQTMKVMDTEDVADIYRKKWIDE